MSDQGTIDGSTGGGPFPEIPDFDLIRPIGSGGFGQVWLAANQTTGHLRAIKLIPLHRSGATDPAGREITSITRLEEHVRTQHPNLLAIYHVGKTADHLFYVMDPADDVAGNSASPDPSYQPATLQRRLENGLLSPEECFRYARELLTALAHLHESGMVHRDVKPANCLFLAGQLKLADFGLLTEADPQASRVGTQKYMPPDGRMDARADVYAAGLVIYEMVTGLPADGFPRLGQRAHQVVEDPILGMLNRLVLRACQPDPAERFQDGREMLAVLVVPPSQRAAGRRRPRRRILAAVASVCFVVTLAAVALWLSRPQPVPLPQRVDVNFITEPYFEATVYLDGKQRLNSAGTPYKTPCTIPNLPARVHHVVLKHLEHDDLVVGPVDFAKRPEIVARWLPP